MTRAFLPTPIARERLDRIVDLAARAPSAGKTQGWHLIVLEGADTARYWDVTLPRERRDGFAWPHLLDAPVVMVVLADPDAYVERYGEPDKAATGLGSGVDAWSTPYWTVDASMAAMTLLLAAEDDGLGALFFGVFDHEPAVRDALGIPDRLQVIGTIALGEPRPGSDRPGRSASRPRRTPADVVHPGRW